MTVWNIILIRTDFRNNTRPPAVINYAAKSATYLETGQTVYVRDWKCSFEIVS